MRRADVTDLTLPAQFDLTLSLSEASDLHVMVVAGEDAFMALSHPGTIPPFTSLPSNTTAGSTLRLTSAVFTPALDFNQDHSSLTQNSYELD